MWCSLTNTSSLRATLKLPQITALYIGSVLGSGILIIPGIAAEIAGPYSLISWGIMSILVLPMSLTMGFLSARYPNPGGVSYFVSKAFNPRIGSLVGWLFLMSVVVGAPVLALTGSGYLCAALGLNDTYRLFIAVIILLVGLLTNYFGIKLTGQIQIAVVITTLAVLIITIIGGSSSVESVNLNSFMPNDWMNIGFATTILFWCFIGWETVSHLSSEFQNPKKDVIRGTVIAAVIINVIYFLTAYIIVGNHSYGANISDSALIHIIKKTFGTYGSVIGGFAALFICIAPAIAYIGAVSRLAYSLSVNGYAPKPLSRISKKYATPVGGLAFLAVSFTVLIVVFSTRIVTMSTLIQIPNASFILTYLGGCAAGVKLFKNSKPELVICCIALVLTGIVFCFVKWTIVYPGIIAFFWLLYYLITARRKTEKNV